MKFKQLEKELRESKYVSNSLGQRKSKMDKSIKSSIISQINNAKNVDPELKSEMLDLINNDKLEQALELAIRTLSSARGIRLSKIRSNKNKRSFSNEE